MSKSEYSLGNIVPSHIRISAFCHLLQFLSPRSSEILLVSAPWL